jgi:hypothetical protein
VKLLLTARFSHWALGMAAASALLAGCSGANSLPSGRQPANVQPAIHQPAQQLPVRASLSASQLSAGAIELIGNDKCNVFPLICVRRGHSASMGIKVTCSRGSQPVKCGKVTWSSKIANRGLKWSFKPNPGNPTVETIHASSSIKLGTYLQYISAKCSRVPSCPKGVKATIKVVQ